MILTANENWKPRADLESRAVHIQLAAISESEQLPEREILDRAEELLPSLLAALCQAIAKCLETNHRPVIVRRRSFSELGSQTLQR